MRPTKTTVPPTQIKSMLLVEDDADQRALIQKMIENAFPRTQLVLAATGPQALAFLEQCLEQGQRLPQLVLLDLYLPRPEDGWRVLDGIRALPAPYHSLPVIILSSSGSREDIKSTYDQMGTSYLIKPTQPQDWEPFFQTLKEYWEHTVCLPSPRLF